MLLNQDLLLFVLGVIFFWLTVASFFLWRTMSHYQKLTAGVQKKKLDEVLEKILKDLSFEGKKADELTKKLEEIGKDGRFHLQKVGLVRFNPFSDTGGNQSFALALLDEEGSGFILSTLHSRDQTRIYAKPVKEGKTKGYNLAKEEREAIEKARKGGKVS